MPRKAGKFGKIATAVVLIIAVLSSGAFVLMKFNLFGVGEEPLQESVTELDPLLAMRCKEAINSTLYSDVIVSRVFDTSGLHLFSIQHSESAGLKNIPNVLSGTASQKLSGNTLSSKAAQLLSKVIPINSDDMTLLDNYLNKTFNVNELISYCILDGNYGNISGLSEACDYYFSKDIASLSKNQIEFLCFSMFNENNSVEEFLSTHDIDEDLNFVDVEAATLIAIKDIVDAELLQFIPDSYGKVNITVRLSLDSKLQQTLKDTIESGLADSKDTNYQGYYILDGNALVVDTCSGVVRGMYCGRNRSTSPLLKWMNIVSNLQNYEKTLKLFSQQDSLSFNTLIPYITELGTTHYSTLKEMVEYGEYDYLNDSPVESSVQDIVDLSRSVYGTPDYRIVTYVKNDENKMLYSYKHQNYCELSQAGSDLFSLMNGSADGSTAEFCSDSQSGILYGRFNNDNLLGVVLGTNTKGYILKSGDSVLLNNLLNKLISTCGTYLGQGSTLIDTNGLSAIKISNAAIQNEAVISDAVDSWVSELQNLKIDSVASRKRFEALYAQYIFQCEEYRRYIDDDIVFSHQCKLNSVRADRSIELLKYIN